MILKKRCSKHLFFRLGLKRMLGSHQSQSEIDWPRVIGQLVCPCFISGEPTEEYLATGGCQATLYDKCVHIIIIRQVVDGLNLQAIFLDGQGHR